MMMGSGDSTAWDKEAASFDQQPDHGLGDPVTRAAWGELLTSVVPVESCDIADLGCGTGSLAVLLAEQGHRVYGIDFSVEMIRAAREKVIRAGVSVELSVADAFEPPLPARSVDVVVCRHVLWALPDPAQAVRRWSALLRPGGRLALVEGRWSTGAGLDASQARELLAPVGGSVEVRTLSEDVYWGGPITDERYLITTVPE